MLVNEAQSVHSKGLFVQRRFKSGGKYVPVSRINLEGCNSGVSRTTSSTVRDRGGHRHRHSLKIYLQTGRIFSRQQTRRYSYNRKTSWLTLCKLHRALRRRPSLSQLISTSFCRWSSTLFIPTRRCVSKVLLFVFGFLPGNTLDISSSKFGVVYWSYVWAFSALLQRARSQPLPTACVVWSFGMICSSSVCRNTRLDFKILMRSVTVNSAATTRSLDFLLDRLFLDTNLPLTPHV